VVSPRGTDSHSPRREMGKKTKKANKVHMYGVVVS
jgi:hypothetical protein